MRGPAVLYNTRRFDDATVKKPKTCRDVADVAKSFGRSLETSTYVTREGKEVSTGIKS